MERVTQTFLLPDGAHPSPFIDRDMFIEPGRSITVFGASKQVLITDEASIPSFPIPASVLLTRFGVDLATLQSRGATVEGRSRGDAFKLTITVPRTGVETMILDVDVDPALEFAVTHWRVRNGRLHADIEWTRGATDEIVPVCATLVIDGDADHPTQSWTMRATAFEYGPPPAEVVSFRPSPGQLVTDHTRPRKDGTLYGYKVGEDLQPEEILILGAERPVSGTTRLGVLSGILAVVAMGMAIRLRLLR